MKLLGLIIIGMPICLVAGAYLSFKVFDNKLEARGNVKGTFLLLYSAWAGVSLLYFS